MFKAEKPPKEHLNEIISQGVKWQIFEAEAAIKLYEEIGNHKNDLDRNRFDNLFGFLQSALLAQIILAVGKIYEHPRRDGKYPPRSIYAALNLLQERSTRLNIEDREQLEQKLISWHIEDELITKSDPEVTNIIVEKINKTLSEENIRSALDGLRELRDKRIAHSEAIDETKLRQILWRDIENLLKVAKEVVGIIGNHYLGVLYEQEGKYELSSDAARISSSLSRLLKKI